MNKIQTSLLAGGMLVASIIGPTATFAQGTSANDPMYNQSSQGTSSDGTTGSTNTQTQNDNRGFDWRWLLPLLAIPVIFMLTRRGEDTDRRRDTGQYSVGAKGGRSTRNDDE